MSELILLSASQIGTALLCKRKWGISYIDGIKTPPTAAMQAGTDLHLVAEQWLEKKKIPDPDTKAGRLFMPGMKFLPTPSPELLIEHSFVFDDGPLRWRGFIDLIDPRPSPPRITDHKTTSSFYWSKTEYQLLSDPQSIIYAKYYLDKHNLDLVEGQWIYYLKNKTPRAKEVLVLLEKPHVDVEYKKLQKTGLELLDLKNRYSTGLDIPVEFPNAGCKAFGGCEHMDFCEKLNDGRVPMSSLLSKLKGMGNNGKVTDNSMADAVAMAAVINPPTTEPIAEPIVEEVVTKPAVEEPPKRKRGRPKKVRVEGEEPPKRKSSKASVEASASSPEPVGDPSPGQEPIEEPGQDQEPTQVTSKPDLTIVNISAEVEEVAEAETVKDFKLYINCMPMTGSKDISDVVSEAADIVCAKHGVEHYRFIQFGKAQGTLCLALKDLLADKPLHGAYVADTSNQLVNDSLPVLAGLAVEIVRAIR